MSWGTSISAKNAFQSSYKREEKCLEYAFWGNEIIFFDISTIKAESFSSPYLSETHSEKAAPNKYYSVPTG